MVRASRFRSGSATSLAAALLLGACSEAPTASLIRGSAVTNHAGDILTDAATPNVAAIIVSPDQALEEGENPIAGRFHANFHIQSDGDATGSARLVYDAPEGSRPVVLVLTFTRADIDVAGGTFVARFEGEAEVCSETGCRTFPITGTVTPESGSDCLIYDIVGPNVSDGVVIEARGRLVLPSS